MGELVITSEDPEEISGCKFQALKLSYIQKIGVSNIDKYDSSNIFLIFYVNKFLVPLFSIFI